MAERAAATAAGVDINVLQCDDNISFADSTTDVTASPQQTVCLFLACRKFSSSCRKTAPVGKMYKVVFYLRRKVQCACAYINHVIHDLLFLPISTMEYRVS